MAGGLQIFNPKTQSWIDAIPISGAFAVNLGDTMQLRTGQEYRSALHGVVDKSRKQRYSIASSNEMRLDYRVKNDEVEQGGKMRELLLMKH